MDSKEEEEDKCSVQTFNKYFRHHANIWESGAVWWPKQFLISLCHKQQWCHSY